MCTPQVRRRRHAGAGAGLNGHFALSRPGALANAGPGGRLRPGAAGAAPSDRLAHGCGLWSAAARRAGNRRNRRNAERHSGQLTLSQSLSTDLTPNRRPGRRGRPWGRAAECQRARRSARSVIRAETPSRIAMNISQSVRAVRAAPRLINDHDDDWIVDVMMSDSQ